jgi:hypothetical protein
MSDDEPPELTEPFEPPKKRRRRRFFKYSLLWPLLGIALVVAIVWTAFFKSPDQTSVAPATPLAALQQQRTQAIKSARDLCEQARAKADSAADRQARTRQVERGQALVLTAWSDYKWLAHQPASQKALVRLKAADDRRAYSLSWVVRRVRGQCASTRKLSSVLTTR